MAIRLNGCRSCASGEASAPQITKDASTSRLPAVVMRRMILVYPHGTQRRPMTIRLFTRILLPVLVVAIGIAAAGEAQQKGRFKKQGDNQSVHPRDQRALQERRRHLRLDRERQRRRPVPAREGAIQEGRRPLRLDRERRRSGPVRSATSQAVDGSIPAEAGNCCDRKLL
jgi:hypothetical protein